MSKTENEDFVTASRLQEILNVTSDRLHKLREVGMPHTGFKRATKYPLTLCIQWYIAYEVQRSLEKQKSPDTVLDKDEAMVRKMTAEALIKEVELEQIRGTLVNIEDAEKDLGKHLGIVRGGLLSFPARVSPYLVGLKTEADAREMITMKVHELMTQIATQAEEIESDVEVDDEESET